MSGTGDDAALIRRVEAAAWSAAVRRSEVEMAWPECHKPRCQHQHGRIGEALNLMQHAVCQAVRDELRHRTTTRPDLRGDGEDAADEAVLTLAVLLSRYRVQDAGTYVKAAQLLVDAYPEFVPVLAGAGEDES